MDHEHVWVEAVVVEAPAGHQDTLGATYAVCGICGQGKGAGDLLTIMEKTSAAYFRAQADALEATARWADQPDEPTGARGLLTSHDLQMRAIALRTQADVLSEGI